MKIKNTSIKNSSKRRKIKRNLQYILKERKWLMSLCFAGVKKELQTITQKLEISSILAVLIYHLPFEV